MGLLLATIGVVALWSERTLGSPTVNPYSEYSRLNMPFDRMGFGVDPTPPIRRFPADLQGVFDQWRRIHAEHTWPRLPTIAAYRALTLLQQLGGGWRRGLLVLFVAGIGISTTLEGLLVWSVACMFLGYLAFAHPSAWTVYYVEIFPAVFLLAVAQYWRLGMKGEPDPDRKRARGDALLAVSLAVVLPLMWADVGDARVMRQVFLSFHHHAVSRFEAIPESRALVFVRPGPHHDPNLSLISAPVNGSSDRLWVVRSTGDESRRLCEIARDRAPYVYDEESGSLLRGGCPSP